MLLRFWAFLLFLLWAAPPGHGLTVRRSSNGTQQPQSSDVANVYRASVAQAKQPSNRVPAHLQDIHHGLVYNDADDVIHIIEPPQRFQHMKRLIHQKGDSPPWTLTPAAVASAQPSMKVKDAAKVDRLVWPKAGAPYAADAMAQTSQLQPHFAVPQHLPMQILASVRNTERLLRMPHRSAQFGAPYAKQRLKTRKIQSVRMEKRFERDRSQHAKQWALGAEHAKRERRVKRSAQTSHSSDKAFKLLRSIDELLKNASAYLPATAFEDEPPQQTRLIGEIELGDAKVLNELLTNALNASEPTTHGKLMRKRNLVKATTNDAQLAQCKQPPQPQPQQLNATTLGNVGAGVERVRAQIDCLNRLFAHAPTPRFGARLRSKTNSVGALQMLTNEQMAGKSSAKRHGEHAAPVDTANEPSLLYADVMTNIRNMLQANNLSDLAASLHQPHAAWLVDNGSALRPPKQIAHAVAPSQLSGYLQELQRIVAALSPTAASTKLEQPTRRDDEIAADRNDDPDTALYFINGDGQIFGTNLTNATPLNGSVFQRFPDIPNAALYISNRTFAGDGNDGSTIEILTP